MKKLLSCLLILTMVISICSGCGKNAEVVKNENDTTNQQVEQIVIEVPSENKNNNNENTNKETPDIQVEVPEKNENNQSSTNNKENNNTNIQKPSNDKVVSNNNDTPNTNKQPETSHTHSYSQTVTNATCTSTGIITYICSCSDSYTETIPAIGHSWIAATCTEAQYCANCGTTDGSALGHSDNNGICSRCGVQLEIKQYEYKITYSGADFYSGKYVNGSMRNQTRVTNIYCSYDGSKNPTTINVEFLVTKNYQGSVGVDGSAYTIENSVYVVLYDVNGNQIGQKEAVTYLEDGESQMCNVFFQVPPGIYSIKLHGGSK